MIYYSIQIFLNSLAINWLTIMLSSHFVLVERDVKSISLIMVFSVISNALTILITRFIKVDLINNQPIVASFVFSTLLFFIGFYKINLIWYFCFILFLVFAKIFNSNLFASANKISQENSVTLEEVNKTFYLSLAFAFMLISFLIPAIANLGIKKILFIFMLLNCLNLIFYEFKNAPQKLAEKNKLNNLIKKDSDNSNFFSFLTNPIVLKILVFSFLYLSVVEVFSICELPILNKNNIVTDKQISTVYIATLIGNVISILYLPNFFKKYNQNIIISLNIFLSYFVIYFFLKSETTHMFSLFGFLFGLGNGLYGFSVGLMILNEKSMNSRKSFYLINSLISSLFSLAAGLLLNLTSLSLVLFIFKKIMLIFSIIIFLYLIVFCLKLYSEKITKFLIVLIIVSCGSIRLYASDFKTILVSHLTKDLNPFDIPSTDVAFIGNQVFDKLFSFNDRNELVPRIASRITWCGDQKCLKVSIKNNILFSNNDSLTVKDVKKSIEQSALIQGSGIAWALGNLVGFEDFINRKTDNISGIKISGIEKIEFEFKEKTPLFAQFLATPYFFISKKDVKGNWIGSGHYIVNAITNDYIEIVSKNKEDGVTSKWRFIKNISDKFDLSFIINSEHTEQKGISQKKYPLLQTTLAIFNLDSLKNKISAAERCFLAKNLDISFQSIREKWDSIAFGIPFNWQIDQLKEVQSFIKPNSKKSIKINAIYADTYVNLTGEIVERIRQQLKNVGIDITFEKIEKKRFFDRAKLGQFEILIMDYIPDYPSIDSLFYPLLFSNQQFNWGHYSNKNVDGLLRNARLDQSKLDSNDKYSKVINIIRNECPIAFLGFAAGRYSFSEKLAVPNFSSLGFHNLFLNEIREIH